MSAKRTAASMTSIASIISAHIAEMKKAVVEDGVDLMGYTPWGCIDLVSAGTGEMKNATALFMSIKIMKAMARWHAAGKSPLPGISR